MREPPRALNVPLLDPASLRFILTTGAIKAVGAFALLAILPLMGISLELSRTVAFLFMSVGQLLFAYPARRTEVTPRPNRWLHFAVVAGVAAQLPIVLVPALREAFDVVPGPVWLAVVIAVSATVSWLAAEAVGRVVWHRASFSGRTT
jgi:Ca2+-transporting ATPase